MTAVKKADIPGGAAPRKRKNRADTIEKFIDSGDESWIISVEENEFAQNVYSTFYNAIKTRPYFSARCYIVRRYGVIYLVRK